MAAYLCYMNIIKLLFQLFVIYILYKFIFDLIIPVYKTTKQVKQKMNAMQERMDQQHQPSGHNQSYHDRQQAQPTARKPASEDYIDYEEVK